MLERSLYPKVIQSLNTNPVVALLGCRQVGKTTLAMQIQKDFPKPSLYLDLELPEDRAKLSDPQLYLEQHTDKLLILDEIQRMPDLFTVMRGIIDRRKRSGETSGQYLILGPANPNLLKQSSESLAGRISYLELDPLNLTEVTDINKLWLRGGFPNSFLSAEDNTSFTWRNDFIRSYLERDLLQLAQRLPSERIHTLWKMVAFDQGNLLSLSRLSSALGVSGSTVKHYLEVMSDLFLIRFLRPWAGNSTKRLIRAPKVYVRDSGLLHALTKLTTIENILSHSLCGLSWEGFAIEQILQIVPNGTEAMFYRSNAGAEIDLVLEMPGGKVIAIEIKRTVEPTISKGFRLACEDIKAHKRFYLIPQGEAFPLDSETQAIGLRELVTMIRLSQFQA